MLSKEQFLKYIKRLQDVCEFDNAVSQLARDHHIELFESGVSELVGLCIELLEITMNCFDENYDDISYFCLELDFGKLWEPGMVTDYDENKNSVDVDFNTAEELYDYLVARYNEGR